MRPVREVFQTPGPVALDLRIPQGEIEVETDETQETEVVLTGVAEDELTDVTIHCRERGGAYEVRVEVDDRRGLGRFWKSRNLRLEVRAPAGADLRARGGSADVRARGTYGELGIETGSGDVEVHTVTGDASIKSGSGDVHVRDVSGNASVATGSGDIDVGRAGGDVHLGEGGHDVTVQTASGDQQVDAVVQGQVTLQSASGDMNVGVRRGSRLAVDARSMSGDTTSEIELDEYDHDPGDTGEAGPLVEVRATTMSGDIHVARA